MVLCSLLFFTCSNLSPPASIFDDNTCCGMVLCSLRAATRHPPLQSSILEEVELEIPSTLPSTQMTVPLQSQGAVTSVKDQGALGTCWIFSTVGNLEGQRFLNGQDLVDLSVEHVLECDATTDAADQDGNGELSKQEWLDMVHGLTTKEAMAVDHYVKAEVERKAREEEEAKKKRGDGQGEEEDREGSGRRGGRGRRGR